MFLKNLKLVNFRLHRDSSLQFSENLNFFIGGNGQGKTSLLEAIYYLSTTKSLIGASDSEAVTFGESFFEIIGSFGGLTNHGVKVFYSSESRKKQVFLDDKQISNSTEIIGRFPVVTLTQSDHYITFGAPAERRKFVDSVISQASKAYLSLLLDYGKVLRQRAALLREIKDKGLSRFRSELDAWTETLAKLGAQIIKHRVDFIPVFKDYLKSSYYEIMKETEIPDIEYPFLNAGGDFQQELLSQLENKREEEIQRGKNLIGPHRDDFLFKINDIELRRYGSQGQHKTFQIALRFAQFFYLKDKISRTPIFLMDDIFGELDSDRSHKISDFLKRVGQAFITMTDFTSYEGLISRGKDFVIKVENGVCRYE